MAQVSRLQPPSPGNAATPDQLPSVRLELHQGSARAIIYELSDPGFLIGCVPGCDLRLPSADLPPVLCLITRHAGGVALRKLVPTQPLFVNGRPLANGPLVHGDRLKLGPVEILVHIGPGPGGRANEEASRSVETGGSGSVIDPTALTSAEQAETPNDLEAREKQLACQQQEVARLGDELAEIRRQLYERYRERRDRLAGLQEAVDRAARKVQERKRYLDAEFEECAARVRDLKLRQAEIDNREAEIVRDRQLLDERERMLSGREQDLQDEETTRRTDSEARAQKLTQEMQQRLADERQVLHERETSLALAEQARAALQEQLRRRALELAARQQSLAEQAQKQDALSAALETRLAEIEAQRTDLARREHGLIGRIAQLKQGGRKLAAARKSSHQERTHWLVEQQEAREQAARSKSELETVRHGVLELQQQLPQLMMRAQNASERLTRAREQLCKHLDELHGYVEQRQEAVKVPPADVQVETGQVREQQEALHRAREEHRLAVAAFRQQLTEWQGQLVEMRRSVKDGKNRLAHVGQQTLQAHESAVAEPCEESERHLGEMREWYRRKLRELSLVRTPAHSKKGDRSFEERGTVPLFGTETTAPGRGSSPRDILTFTREVEQPDRKLMELLLSSDLVDAETLAILLDEAASQHRSLRQALLAGGYLTLYQMALIETGNLEGLVLGPLRIIDRLRIAPCEVVYQVFDPRRNQEAVFRYLAEAQMQDAVHAEEFRQRFAQAATLKHAQLGATLEVLQINGRPGVLQESVLGLPSSDWPGLTAVPGVWCRLLSQAGAGLHAAHQAGLIHGHLQPASFVLNREGILKLCGIGEPGWLLMPPDAREDAIVADDLADLGRIAAGWGGLAGRRKASQRKSLPEAMRTVLGRLTAANPEARYPSAAALVADLEQMTTAVPAHTEAWERLLEHVRTEAAENSIRRQSA